MIAPAVAAGQPQDHPADGRLAAPALADQRDDLAGLNVEAHVGDSGQLGAAEHARPEDLRDAVELEHQPSTFQHAAKRPGSISTNGGSSAHFSNASGQRARNRHPVGGLRSDGGLPGMPVSRRSSKRTPTSGSDASRSLRVRMPRVLGDRRRRRLLDELARVHHEDRVGDLVEDREVVRDHDRALHELPVAELDEHLGDRLLGRDVERGGQLVGDQQRRVHQRREHHHDALLHPARQLDRVPVEDAVVEADEREAAAQLGKRLVVGDAARVEQLGDHPPDLPDRVERAHRVLRDDRHLAEPEGVHGAVVDDRQLDAVELHRPFHDVHAPVEPDEALAERRLAAARLAGETHDLAVGDGERDAVERRTSPRRVR